MRWLGAATSNGRSVSGSQAPTQTACHGTLFSLTTILKHPRQVWNHYSDTLPKWTRGDDVDGDCHKPASECDTCTARNWLFAAFRLPITESPITAGSSLSLSAQSSRRLFYGPHRQSDVYTVVDCRRPCLNFAGRQRSFWGRTRGNAIHIVKVFKNALWAALETIFRIKCTRLQDFEYTISKFFRGVVPPSPEIRNRPGVLGPRHQIPFGSRAFHCSCFMKGPLPLVLTQSMRLEQTTTPRHVCTVHVLSFLTAGLRHAFPTALFRWLSVALVKWLRLLSGGQSVMMMTMLKEDFEWYKYRPNSVIRIQKHN